MFVVTYSLFFYAFVLALLWCKHTLIWVIHQMLFLNETTFETKHICLIYAINKPERNVKSNQEMTSLR